MKCSSMIYKFVNRLEEIVKVLLVINQICSHGDCDTIITLRMIDESPRTASTLSLGHIILTELCEAQLKLIEVSRGNYILSHKRLASEKSSHQPSKLYLEV